MKLFQSKKGQLTPVRTIPFKTEKEIQSLVETNVQTLFGLEFVQTELTVTDFRIDTLCFDPETKSFVIIEYKKGKSWSVIDQGYTYLSLLLNNKSDFVLEYNETKGKSLKRDEVDWSQSRVIFVSPRFTEYQKHSVNFRDIPFELWEIDRYSGDTLGLTRHQSSSSESIEGTLETSDSRVGKVSREVKVYTEEYHRTSNKRRKQGLDGVWELYENLRDRVLELDNVEVVPRSQYIGFQRDRPFVDVIFGSSHLLIMVNLKKGELEDPRGVTEDVSEKGHWGNGDYRFRLRPGDDLDYPMTLIRQSYDKQT
jgi:predicted transport protein